MIIGIPKEIAPGEKRVAITPTFVGRLGKLGATVYVEAGAGDAAELIDGAYAEAGARVVSDAELWAESDIVLKVRAPMLRPDGTHEADLIKQEATLISFFWPGQNPELIERMAARKATVLAMDAMPRISRAQRMDALSAMASVVGYRAVIEAVTHFGRFFPGQVTAAGRVKPAQVLVLGAGVAGLAAIATARSLGAQVRAFDTRPSVREQVESLGATFLAFHFDEMAEGGGGYAKQMSEGFIAAEQALIAEHAKEVDIIISTAVIPYADAPKLITSGAVVSMKHGSVIVDLAAEQGGNCVLTERDSLIERFGVKIIGFTDLASRMAEQSSELYAGVVYALLVDVWNPERKDVVLDLEDQVHRGIVVLHRGQLLWPPPKPKPPSHAPRPLKSLAPPPIVEPRSKTTGTVVAILLIALFTLAGLYAPSAFLQHLTVFLLACVVGWHVVWNVTPALHTPLMSVTNAISGIILIGGVLLLRVGGAHPATLLAGAAICLAMINVAGGFLVTARMLKMFRRAPLPSAPTGPVSQKP